MPKECFRNLASAQALTKKLVRAGEEVRTSTQLHNGKKLYCVEYNMTYGIFGA